MSRIAFCARLGRRPELREVAAKLASMGHEVVSSWVFRDDRDEDMDDAGKMEVALANYNDSHRAQVVVLFGEKQGTLGADRAGRHGDFTATFHLGQTITRVIVGPRENVNCFWPGVVHVDSTAGLVAMLRAKQKS